MDHKHSIGPPPVIYDARGTIRDVPSKPHEMTAAITPTDKLFMLAHLGVVRFSPEDWRLDVTGLVTRPLRLRLRDLARFPVARVEAIHQCAGNPLTPTIPTRRIACVVWEGVRLRDVLSEAGVRSEASYIWSDGADSGIFEGEDVPFYRKDLPLTRLDEDVLLATRVNGKLLSNRHGGPVRLVVPGFYATNSVKWLWRITLADRRADGLFTTKYYNDRLSESEMRPVWALHPESIILSPVPGERVPATPFELRGWAWGDTEVSNVDVSDDGAHWIEAEVAPRRARTWQSWHCTWTPTRPGAATFMCRATDSIGYTQFLQGTRNAVHRVEVTVLPPS